MILGSDNKRPEIEYPTEWSYKIIGTDVDLILKSIEEVVGDLEHEVTPSNVSKNDNYYSLNLKVLVPSEVVRDLIYQKLEECAEVKMVL